MEDPVLLYDGVCGFCNRLVQFVLRHDDKKIFRFAALQSSFGSRVLTQHGVDTSATNTAYVLVSGEEGQVLLQRSAAILFVMGRFGGIWSALAQIVRLLPLRIRDWGTTLSHVIDIEFLDGMRVVPYRVRRIASDSWICRLEFRVLRGCLCAGINRQEVEDERALTRKE